MSRIKIKMAKSFAERLLRKADTVFINVQGDVIETIGTARSSAKLVDTWKVAKIFYKGGYWNINQ